MILNSIIRHGTLRSAGGPGSSVRPVGDGREERGRLALGPMSPDSNAIDLYYNPRPPSDHSWRYAFLFCILISQYILATQFPIFSEISTFSW